MFLCSAVFWPFFPVLALINYDAITEMDRPAGGCGWADIPPEIRVSRA